MLFRKITILSFVVLSTILLSFSANSKTLQTTINFDAFINKSTFFNTANSFTEYSFKAISLNEPILFKTLKESNQIIIKGFPVSEKNVAQLNLKRIHSVVDGNTEFYTQTKFGHIRLSSPEVYLFSGSIDGESGSEVHLISVDGIMYCNINYSDGRNYVLAPSNKELGIFDNYVIVNQANLVNANVKTFDFQIKQQISEKFRDKIQNETKILNWDKLLETELALETDSDFFKACGSDLKKAQAYAIAIVNMVSLLYTKEVNICFYLKWLKTWTDSPADPYSVNGDAYALPPKVLEYWKNNYKDVERDLAHVMTSIYYGGGGFGYFNALCGKAGDNSFAVSSVQGNHTYPTVDFTYDIYILAHEMGHNFNASHTHSCDFGYPLDTCVAGDAIAGKCLDSTVTARPNPGSIMSYCGGTNNSAGLGYWVRMLFLPQSKDQIRTAAESAECLTEPAKPKIVLNLPQGNEIFKPGDTTIITWSSSHVSTVNLSFSTDNGKNWADIAKSINSSVREYSWVIPAVCSKQMKVRISDLLADSVFDESRINFSILLEDTTGLVAYYPFSGNFNDEQMCHFYNLQGAGKPISVNDRIGSLNSSVQFDGSSYLFFPQFPVSFDELTLSFWFNAEDMSIKRNIIGTNYAEGYVTEIYLWGQFGASYYVDGQGVPKQIWGGSPELKKWNHGAFTFEGKSAKLYLNGKLVGESSDGSHILNKFPNTPLYIGSRKDNDYFKGMLDDIFIYKKALSQDEIIALYNQKPTAIEWKTPEKNDIEIFPNPSSDKLYIDFSNSPGSLKSINLVNCLGERIRKIQFINLSCETNIHTIDVNDIPSGIYLMKMEFGNELIIKKIVITK